MMGSPYRAGERQEPLMERRSVWQYVWQYARLLAFAVATGVSTWMLVIKMPACLLQRSSELALEEQRREAQRQVDAQARHKAAAAWLDQNGLAGSVRCFTNVTYCDIVPKDARPPFVIQCSSAGCDLVKPR